jgi:hypothetical protein
MSDKKENPAGGRRCEAVVSYLVVKLAKYYDLVSTTDPT